ncbi:MFSD10 [Cordylochernes scorpioides]|uniref:MFSD10 n=1 Tax=Cordylochernes scorpioides TaxID=51811 RepID=A0ABY6KX93_9ARAC|nr:MFSD10 [Cordylochernes scorpioides]
MIFIETRLGRHQDGQGVVIQATPEDPALRVRGDDGKYLPDERSDVAAGPVLDSMASTKEDQPPRLPGTVYVIFVSLIIDLLGFTLILPLFPSIFDYYSQHDKDGLYQVLNNRLLSIQQQLGVPQEFNKVLFGGFLGSLFSLLQYFSSALMGAMSDVYGRKPILMLSLAGIASSYALWAVSGSFALFVLARVLGGISKANISLSTAVMADVCPPSTRNKGMALVGIAFSIGFIVGPSIGAVFSTWARQMNPGMGFFVMPALTALGLSLLDLLVVGLCFRESLPADKRAPSIGQGLGSAVQYLDPVSLFGFSSVPQQSSEVNVVCPDHRHLQRVGLVYFLYLFLYSGLEFTLTFLTHIRLDYTRMQQAWTYLFSGAVMMIVQGGVTRRISPGKEGLMALRGLQLIIPAYLVMGVAVNSALLYLGLFLYALSTAFVVPCLTTLAANLGPEQHKGRVLGVFRSLGALARALGPCSASLEDTSPQRTVFICKITIYTIQQLSMFWVYGPCICYTLGSVLLIIPTMLLRRLIPAMKTKVK